MPPAVNWSQKDEQTIRSSSQVFIIKSGWFPGSTARGSLVTANN